MRAYVATTPAAVPVGGSRAGTRSGAATVVRARSCSLPLAASLRSSSSSRTQPRRLRQAVQPLELFNKLLHVTTQPPRQGTVPAASRDLGGGSSGGQQQGLADLPSLLQNLQLPGAILPFDKWWMGWSAVATAAAALSGFLIPWEVAFVPPAELYSFGSPWAALNLLMVALFGADMALSSRLAYFEGERLVVAGPETRRHYLHTDFALDFLGFLPADWLLLGVLAGAGTLGAGGDASAAAAAGAAGWSAGGLEWLPLLRLLHLARLYRVRKLFSYLEYNLNVSLLQVTILRNLFIVLLCTHWTASAFFWAGAHSGFSSEVMYGADAAFVAGLGASDAYIYSLFWAVTTLSMVEANELPRGMGETVSATVRASLFMFFNTALGSYIVGTITLLVVKADERTGEYRERSTNLNQYTSYNQIPADLKDSLQEHLRLHFDTQDASDEQVLSVFPTVIRRRILQYLYVKHLRASYLFKRCPQRFLDSLLTTAKIEVFMPGVDILSSGDAVSEMLLLLSGTAEIISPDPAASAQPSSSLAPQGDAVAANVHPDYTSDNEGGSSGSGGSGSSNSSNGLPQLLSELSVGSVASVDGVPGGAAFASSSSSEERRAAPLSVGVPGEQRLVQEGSLLGEAAFFTEVPQLEAVRSLSVCRVLVVSKAAYASLERSFPHSARLVLHNLKRKAESAVGAEFRGKLKAADLDELWAHFSRLQFGWASTELQDEVGSLSLPSLDHADIGEVASWSPRQQQVMGNLLRIRAMAAQYILRQEVERTTDFLWAASQGNEAKVRQMLQAGTPPDSADYDGRTALELACVKGHAGVVKLLIDAGCDVNAQDQLGSCALLETCAHGHDDILATLKRAGASLDGHKSSVEQAAVLCTAVFEGNLPLLRRLISAGCAVDAGDYDKRTALHISASEGNLQACRLLIEEGGADPLVADRWGHTPLDEALRVGAGPVVRYFTSLGLTQEAAGAPAETAQAP